MDPTAQRCTSKFSARPTTNSSLTFNYNAWECHDRRQTRRGIRVVKKVNASSQWQTISVALDELNSTDPKVTASLANWQTVTEFSISPTGTIVKDGQKVKVEGEPWRGPREIRAMRWEGGEYPAHRAVDSVLTPDALKKSFDDAIRKSLEEEKTPSPNK